MTGDQAKALATLLVGRWGGGTERLALFTLTFTDPGLVYEHALTAVREMVMEDREKCPTPNQVLGAYHGAKKAASVTTSDGAMPMCHFCLAEGGWHLDHSDTKYPPREACPPYLPTILLRDDANKVLGPAWGHPPACASHGRQISRKQGHGGWEPPRVKEHRDEIREWRDRWEAEHAIAAAAALDAMVVPPHHPTQEVASAGQPTASVAVVDDGPRPLMETLTDILSLGRMTDCEVAALPSDEKPPPMTADEEADFDRGIRF